MASASEAPALISHLASATVSSSSAGPDTLSPATIIHAQRLLSHFPESLRQQARQDAGAIGVAGGVFLTGRDDIRARQEALIPPASLPMAREIGRWLAVRPERGAPYRLIWLDLALPVLREMPEEEHGRLLAMADGLIRADGRVDASEFALYSLIRASLPSVAARRRAARGAFRLERLDHDIRVLLSFTAHAGNADAAAAEAAYLAAEARAPVRVPRPPPARSDLSLAGVSEALDHLALAAQLYRETVLRACAVAIGHDGTVTPVENELLHAYAQCLDCPVPLMSP